jgi:hypothetical protein
MAEPTTNNLVTTTINNYHDDFADNVSNSNALTALLKMGNRVRVIDGGKQISCPLTYAEETFAWYSGTKAVYGDGTVAKSFAGLKAFITDNGLGTVGGIDSSTWTFWKNQFQSIARATGLQYPALKAGMNALWMKLVRGTEHPDLVVADGEFYSTYESGLQENQRYADARLGALGFETLKYKQAAVVFDGAATGLVGGYMINTKYMKFEIYSGRNFEMLDLPDQSPDMDAITRHIAFMGAITLSNRSLQGRVLFTGT